MQNIWIGFIAEQIVINVSVWKLKYISFPNDT